MTFSARSLIPRVLLIVLVALAVGAAALAFSSGQPRTYQAVSLIEYGRVLPAAYQVLAPFNGQPDIDEEVEIQTKAAEVGAFEVAAATAKAAPDLGFNAGQIDARVNATGRRSTSLVVVTSEGTDRQLAERLGRAYVTQYFRLLREHERAFALRVQRALETRLNGLSTNDDRGPIGATLRSQIGAVRLVAAVGTGTPRLIEAARAGGAASKPQTRRNVLFGLLFGLAVGIGLVALRPMSASAGAERERTAERTS